MTGFDVGHRVMVKPENGYDRPNASNLLGLMGGHYGRVVEVLAPELVAVAISGKVGGPVNPYALGGPASLGAPPGQTAWYFYTHELEHAD